jgi:hypothetical protein
MLEHFRNGTAASRKRQKGMETTMRIDQERERPGPLQGQVLRRSERREVAIFLLDDAFWVADFVDGQGELVDAATWVRFNCGRRAPRRGSGWRLNRRFRFRTN